MIARHMLKSLGMVVGLAIVLTISWSHIVQSGAGYQANAEYQAIPKSRPVYLIEGTCEEPGQVKLALNSLASPSGDLMGVENRDRTESSNTGNIPYTISALLAEPHAIKVLKEPTDSSEILACGNVGGVVEVNGALVLGLREVDKSGVTGIVYLAPNAGNAVLSLASVFVSGPGLGTAIGTDQPTPTPVAIDDSPSDGDDDVDLDDDDDGSDDDEDLPDDDDSDSPDED